MTADDATAPGTTDSAPPAAPPVTGGVQPEAAASAPTAPPLEPAGAPLRTPPASLTDEQQAWVDAANREDVNGWVRLTVSGSPEARGFAYGYLVPDEYAESVRVYRKMTYETTGMFYEFFVEKAAELHADKLGPEITAEMQGIADGLTAAGVPTTLTDIIGVNAWMELTGYWWPKYSFDFTALAPTGSQGNHCSAFIATGSATADGGIVCAHTSFADFWQGQFENVILDITPENGHRMVMQTAPGWIASMSDFWITDAGLIVTETTIGGYEGFKGYDEKRTPEYVRARRATQYATSIDEWITMLNQDSNGGYANSWLVGDTGTGEIARYEEGLLYQSLKRTTDGYFWGDNTPTDPRIRNLECEFTGFDDIRTPNGARQVRWAQMLAEHDGEIDVTAGQRMIGDTFDPYLGYTNPSSRTICAQSDKDAAHFSGLTPFEPFGSIDAKIATSESVGNMSLWGLFGRADGSPFSASAFVKEHPQFAYQADCLHDRPAQPWTLFEG